jgi:hypothetical protein
MSDSDGLEQESEELSYPEDYSDIDGVDGTDHVLAHKQIIVETQDHLLDSPEIFVQVMSYLNIGDALTCTRVCWKWYISIDDYIWRQVYYTTFMVVSRPLSDPILNQIKRKYYTKCDEDRRCNDQFTWLDRKPWKISLMELYKRLKEISV